DAAPPVKKRKISTDAAAPSFLKHTMQKPKLVTNHKPGYTFKDLVVEIPPPPQDSIVDIFPSKNPKTKAAPSKPRMKIDIMEYSDSDDDSEDSIDMEYTKPVIKFLPATVDGLRARFNELYPEFTRQKTPEHRNELVSILDDMSRQGGITKDEYTRLNNNIAESLDDGEEEENEMEKEMENEELSREEKIKKLIHTTTEYLIEYDKKELVELINEFRKEREYIDPVLELEELIEIFLEEKFLDGEPIIAKIEEASRKLENSRILKSKQHRLKMLVDDIAKNRHRVETIIKRMMDASGEKDILDTLKRLAQEELISEEQYLKLVECDDYDAHKLANVIKETKIGQGLKFLPQKLSDLTNNLNTWLEELIDTGSSVLKNKIRSVLEELLRRKVINQERYTAIKEENKIL
ncbi:MAG: hypothetical protein MK215_05880, partial [Candidatus Poseidoniia archaeon]|nr:hypothetical protein [Candidatus Poseidoniia archaeon]